MADDRPRVVIVDDDEHVLELVRAALEAIEYRVETRSDAKGVVQALVGLPSIWSYSPAQLAGIEAAFGLPAGALPPGVPGLTLWDQVGSLSYWKQETESWAVFAQGTL